eukprot:4262478-Pleurochrysis_carterae.AAC.4
MHACFVPAARGCVWDLRGPVIMPLNSTAGPASPLISQLDYLNGPMRVCSAIARTGFASKLTCRSRLFSSPT